MKPYARIAAIVLGAFAFGIVVATGWRALVSEAADISDRVRRARCAWVDPLVVSVAGREMSLTASPRVTVFTGKDWISGEEVTGYREPPTRFGFCLARPIQDPLPVRAVTIALDAARLPAERAGLPAVNGPVLEIGDAGMFLPGAPDPVGGASDLVVFHRDAEFGWPRMVTEGVDGDGFRIGAVCRDASVAGWLCDVSVLDTRTGLAYRFEQLPVKTVGFEARPVPPAFRAVAQSMRTLGAMLEDEAVARR